MYQFNKQGRSGPFEGFQHFKISTYSGGRTSNAFQFKSLCYYRLIFHRIKTNHVTKNKAKTDFSPTPYIC